MISACVQQGAIWMYLRTSVLLGLGLTAGLTLSAFGVAAPSQATVPGDNGLIAYSALVQSGAREVSQVFTAQPDGTARARVTSGGQSYDPAFSPDGRRLAVARSASDSSGIWTVGLDGTWVRRIASFSAAAVVEGGYGQPAWHPLGHQVAYVRSHELWVVNDDGTADHAVVDTTTHPWVQSVGQPAWSPDGTRIAFSAFDGVTGLFHVYTVSADGTGLAQVTSGESSQPSWSPDGTRLAYMRGSAGNADIWVVDATGDNPRAVTRTAGATGREMHPAWSPDGRRIAFHDFAVDRGVLATVSLDGSARRVVSSQPRAMQPDWQPENRAVSSISLNYSTATLLRANGQVNPAHPGAAVTLELAVKRGGKWVAVTTKSATLSAKSRYVVQFARRSEFECRLTAKFGGDDDHRPSSTAKTFTC
jgi:Tol biopolymer transport system component